MNSELQVGELVRNILSIINERGLWKSSHISILTSKQECSRLFGLNYSLLTKVLPDVDDLTQRNAGTSRPRYYILNTINVEFEGAVYYVCNDLYADQKNSLLQWFKENFKLNNGESMLKYYYVKLSCPTVEDGSKFADLMDSFIKGKNIEAELNNIPTNLEDAKEGDLVFIHMGGDAGKKKNTLINLVKNIKNLQMDGMQLENC